jgi:hypothetical protein
METNRSMSLKIPANIFTLKTLAGFFYLSLFISAPGIAQQDKNTQDLPIFTVESELRNLYDISTLPVYREGSTESQVSSWDRTGGNDDGFSGRFSFVKRNDDSSLVLFDVRGAGAINRIWTPTPTKDMLDFYIDDTLRPALSIQYDDLFSGKVFPFVPPLCGNQLGGYYCYFPVLFQKNCRIVARTKKMQFYQIQYRQYSEGSRVQPFNMQRLQQEMRSIRHISNLWNNNNRKIADFIPASGRNILTKNIKAKISPGEKKILFDRNQGGRILGIEFYIDETYPDFNTNLDLLIRWDNDKNPAVDCPVTDFYGYAFGKPAMESLLLGSKGNLRYCYIPMPFDHRAEILLHYRKGDSLLTVLPVNCKIYYTNTRRDSTKEGRFYSAWNSNILLKGSGPHVFLNTAGKGHYVGTILQARGLYSGMTYFFEGDDSTATDGHFRMHGTGSEDYFNGGWYAFPDRWDGKKSLPLHGCLEYSLPFGRTGGYRFFLNDKVPFEKNIFHAIEHGPVQNDIPVAYTSLALYYCSTAPSQYILPNNKLTTVMVPDTLLIYPQLANLNLWGTVQVKNEWAYPTGGMSFLFTVNDESRIRILLEDIPPGNYGVFADFAKVPDGCSFSLWEREARISEWIPGDTASRQRVKELFLGNISIHSSRPTLTFQFRTDSIHNVFFLNRLKLINRKAIHRPAG